MGYQYVDIPANSYALFTVTFKDVSQQNYPITEIAVCDENGAEYVNTSGSGLGPFNNKIKCQKLDLNDGSFISTEYQYSTRIPSGKTEQNGWTYNSANIKDMSDEDKALHVLLPGEALYVHNTDTSKKAKFRVSGEVRLVPPPYGISHQSYALMGNMTPVPVKITEIKVGQIVEGEFVEFINTSGSGLGPFNNKIKCQKLSHSDGSLISTEYQYSTRIPSGASVQTGWTYGSKAIKDMTADEQAEHVLQPGEAFCVHNTDTSKDAYLKLPEPIK